MAEGARVTDVVAFHRHQGELRGAVRAVRDRIPERFRWRNAVGDVTKGAAALRGLSRMRVEEPIREVVLDLSDTHLKREVVLDARKHGVDLDRGEVLARMTLADLRRLSFLAGIDARRFERYTKMPTDFGEPIDTAACVVIGRAFADRYRRRAHELWLAVPDPDGPEPLHDHHRHMLSRAHRDHEDAKRWGALAKALLAGG